MFTRMLSTKTSITTVLPDWMTANGPHPMADRANCTTASRPSPTLVAEDGHAAGTWMPAELDPPEAPHQVACALAEWQQVWAANLPAAIHLAEHQLAVTQDEQARRRWIAARVLERHQKSFERLDQG